MFFIEGSPLSLLLFLIIVASIVFMFLYGAKKSGGILPRWLGLFLIGWITFFSAIVFSGLLEKNILPALPVFFALINVGAIIFGFSSWGRAFSTLPLWQLVLFHGFRFPLEIVLHLWAESSTIPETMTWTGQNFDIISGILALVVLIPVFRSKTYVWVFNVVGIALLLNVLRVVVMSSPFPFSWSLERPLLLALHMPYAMIGFVCVWAAIVGHIVLTRALIKN